MISGGATRHIRAVIGFLVLGLTVVHGARGVAAGPISVAVRCGTVAAFRLPCTVYAPVDNGTPLRATIAGVEAPVVSHRVHAPDGVAIALLVDTSDPRRQAILDDAARELKTLVAALPDHYRVGLARFDSNPELLHPIDLDRPTLEAKLDTLRATGQHTELYRSTQWAIHTLGAQPAERKVLFLVSDGLAEDRAYGLADTIAEAERRGVSIFGLGFAGIQTVALQVLRRLSEETGGAFAAADGGRLPDWVQNAARALGQAQRIEIDVEPLLDAGFSGAQRVAVRLGAHIIADAPVVLPTPVLPPPIVTAAPAVDVTATPAAVDVTPAPAAVEKPEPVTVEEAIAPHAGPWVWGWITAALLFLLVLAVLWWARRPRPRTLAYLCSTKNDRLRFHLKTFTCRIGRHRHNELVLSDPSVSRFHAQLVSNRNGTFAIFDMDSKNGIRVGNRPVASTLLKEGDVIDLGRVRLRFTQFPFDKDRIDDTVLYESAATRFDKKRRRHPRHPVAMQVRLYHDQVGWMNGHVRDLSQDGAFVETQRSLLPRTPIDMVVPVVERDERRWLRLSGEIVRENNDGFGVLFTEIEPAAARVINTLSPE